jgi:Tfp pilus assembly protein PilX
MHGWHLHMTPEVYEAVGFVLLVVLVLLAVAAILSVSRLRSFGGRGNLERLDDQYIHGRMKFEAYEKAKQEHAHVRH